MKKVIIPILIFLTIYSCNKVREDETNYSFESVADSSFYCSFNTNSHYYKLYNIKPNTSFLARNAKDSIIIGFNYSFKVSDQSILTLGISKSFYSKGFKYNYEGNFNSILSNKEFLSIFQKGQILYAYFSNNSSCSFCDSTAGASIQFDKWSTKYTSKYVSANSLSNFYSDCSFNINSIQILDSANIILRGQFNVKFFSMYSNDYQWLSNGYFKCYAKNLMEHSR